MWLCIVCIRRAASCVMLLMCLGCFLLFFLFSSFPALCARAPKEHTTYSWLWQRLSHRGGKLLRMCGCFCWFGPVAGLGQVQRLCRWSWPQIKDGAPGRDRPQ
ncbi:hypothetical protein LZ32DRAFT_311460 [Colletotrichum eremochloae]|nr:hypothetical protein LZ32DRAFT_311460 [Colletotrichum eremochloae]